MGVAAVDTRTGEVLWEAWRLDEVPPGATDEEKAAVDYLLAAIEPSLKPLPPLAQLPEVPVKDLVIQNPWPSGGMLPAPIASQGQRLIYSRYSMGVIALDRHTGKER